jgi:hypothetical protein
MDRDAARRERVLDNDLEFFGLCVLRIVAKLSQVFTRIDETIVEHGTLDLLAHLYGELQTLGQTTQPQWLSEHETLDLLGRPPMRPGETLKTTEETARRFGERLESLAEDLRDVSMCSKTLVVPRPLEDLIGVCEELFGVLRWWRAVHRGERTIADGPPCWMSDFATGRLL